VTLISGNDRRNELSLNELADALEVDKVSVERSILDFKDIEKTLETTLHVL